MRASGCQAGNSSGCRFARTTGSAARAPASIGARTQAVQRDLAANRQVETDERVLQLRQHLADRPADPLADGVIFLSGDRHVDGLYRRPGAPYALYGITSSGLNMFYAAAREAGPLRLRQVYGRENFGTIDIDWWAGRITLSVRALNGEPVRRTVIALAALSAPRPRLPGSRRILPIPRLHSSRGASILKQH